MRLLHAVGHALDISGSMTWEILWALILGFTLSAVVQAVVRRATIIRLLGDDRNGGISFGGVVAFIFADLIIVPILVIYRKYYGTAMMLFILATFYATMAAAGYLVELIFGGLGLIPAGRHATVTEASIQWNYTTVLNIIFLILAAALCYRFVRSGGIPMLKMMGGGPGAPGDHHDHHASAGHSP